MGLRGAGQVPPLTANGELDRRALPVPEPHCTAASPDYVAPRRISSERCAGSEGLASHRSRRRIHDNFFELGGDSVMAARMVARLRQSFVLAVHVRLVFEHPTLERFSAPCSRISQRPRHVMHKLRVRPLTSNKAIWKLLSRQSRVYPKSGCFRAVTAPGVLSRRSCFWT